MEAKKDVYPHVSVIDYINRLRDAYTIQDELLEALDYLLTQTVDQDLKYGISLSEGEEDARAKALAIIAKATGQEEPAAEKGNAP